jgi:hypothetical protein
VEFTASVRLAFGDDHRLAVSIACEGGHDPDLAGDAAAFGLHLAWCGGVLDLLRHPVDEVTWRGVVARLARAPEEAARLGSMASFDAWRFDRRSPADPDDPDLALSADGHLDRLEGLWPRSPGWRWRTGASGRALAPRPLPPTVDECVLVGSVAALATVHQHLDGRADVLELARLTALFVAPIGPPRWGRASDEEVAELALSLVGRQLLGHDPLEEPSR